MRQAVALSGCVSGRQAAQGGPSAFFARSAAVSQRDGYIPRSVLRSGLHGTASDARLLVETGWWEEAPGGWQIVGYAEDNETAADIAARSLEGLISQCKRWMRQGKHCCCGHHSDTGELVGDPVGDLIAGGDRRA